MVASTRSISTNADELAQLREIEDAMENLAWQGQAGTEQFLVYVAKRKSILNRRVADQLCDYSAEKRTADDEKLISKLMVYALVDIADRKKVVLGADGAMSDAKTAIIDNPNIVSLSNRERREAYDVYVARLGATN